MTPNASSAHSTAVGRALTNRPIGPLVALAGRSGEVDVLSPVWVAGGCAFGWTVPVEVAV
jgi:hypothetical protein